MSCLPESLQAKIEELARVPVLLVACDYDGTLAPIVENPADARPEREAMVAVNALREAPATHVVIISGRSLNDLSELSGAPDGVRMIGSHGSEFDVGFASSLSPEAQALRERIAAQLKEIAEQAEGCTVEEKPASVAFHYRRAAKDVAERAVKQVMGGPAALEGVLVKKGKMVVELSVVETNKGTALEVIRRRVGASAALFIGDDKTDEDAFATLQGPDVGVKVGEGDTQAQYHVDGPKNVAVLLATLAEARVAWQCGAGAVPIEHHAMLSDQRTVALMTPEARLVWMCAPRIDSASLFSELLGGASAGYFSVAAADGSEPTAQRYAGNTLVLETTWDTFSCTDYLDASGGRTTQRAGRTELVRVLRGKGRAVVEFAPRIDFGRIATRMVVREQGLEVEDTLDPIVLRSPGVKWELLEDGPHHTARAEIELGDEPVLLVFRYGVGSFEPSAQPEPERRRQTERFWVKWADRLKLPEVHPEAVRRSALALRGLVYGPTGAVAAAGTMSLPEWIGGVRNWDYRYCWPRDAAMACKALVELGSQSEGIRFLDWLLGVVAELPSSDRIHPIYTVTGRELGSEGEIAELAGYAGSRPVRIGNAAAHQVQLDVFGPIVELVWRLLEEGAPLSSEHWRLVEAMAQAVAARWHEPDHGIWEVRTARRHHVHSKVMCWTAIDLCIRIADRLVGRERKDWCELRDRIREDVLEHGFDPDLGAFTTAYDIREMDAAVLLIGLRGMIDPTDDRFVSTVEAVERELRDGPTVYRYRYDDGLPGSEGGFHLCACWLAEAYAAIGRPEDARTLLDDVVALAGPTGLLSEQYYPADGRALGNHPQAYSHLGIIDAALRLSGNGEARSLQES